MTEGLRAGCYVRVRGSQVLCGRGECPEQLGTLDTYVDADGTSSQFHLTPGFVPMNDDNGGFPVYHAGKTARVKIHRAERPRNLSRRPEPASAVADEGTIDTLFADLDCFILCPRHGKAPVRNAVDHMRLGVTRVAFQGNRLIGRLPDELRPHTVSTVYSDA